MEDRPTPYNAGDTEAWYPRTELRTPLPADTTASQMPRISLEDERVLDTEPAGLSRRAQKMLIGAVVLLSITLCLLVVAHITAPQTPPAPPTPPATQLTQSSPITKNAKLWVDDLTGMNWAEALTTLKDRGADISGLSIETEDGKSVLLPSNWRVVDIAVGVDGHIAVTLTHSTDLAEMVTNAAEEAKTQLENVWESLVEHTTP